jgi:hypothetical protein
MGSISTCFLSNVFFTTTQGGYDWTQIGWDNLWDIRAKLLEYPDGIFITQQFSAPVLADGTRIGHPPIHVHHIHIGPSTGVRQRCNIVGCFINDHECYGTSENFRL